MKYKYLLFDLDGTLFDYDKAELKALEKTFQLFGFGFNPNYLSTYREINKNIWLDFENGKIQQSELKIERFERLAIKLDISYNSKEFSKMYLMHLSEGTDLIENTIELLESLNGDIKLYLITNGLKDVQRPRIANSKISGYFIDTFISEEVGSAKPDSKIFEIAFRKMGNPTKNEVMIIGDSLTSDIAGGNNYGIDTCWFNPELKINESDIVATHEISGLNQLIKIIYEN